MGNENAQVRARLGELLLEAELLSPEQITEALRVQVMWGGRLGTVVSELGYLDLDTVSRALGWQHSLPAALGKHFDSADRELQMSFDTDLAEWYGCVPLLRVGKRVIVIASMSPFDDKAMTAVSKALGIAPDQLVVSIAAELRIRYQHEKVYGITRPHRFLRAPGTERASTMQASKARGIEIPSSGVPLQPLFDEAKAVPQPAPASGSERRNYVPTISKGPPPIPAKALERAQTAPPTAFEAAVQSISYARDRASISALVLDTLARFVRASHGAAVFVVRGKIATSLTPGSDAVSISMDNGLVRQLGKGKRTVRAPGAELMQQDDHLLRLLGLDDDDLTYASIEVNAETVALIAVAARAGVPLEGLEAIVKAVEFAFTRLMREASGPTRR